MLSERRDYVDEVARCLTEGPATALLLVGEVGRGKSAVLAEAGARTGVPVVRVNPWESSWPFAGLSAVAVGLGGWRGEAIEKVVHASDPRTSTAFEVATAIGRALRGAPDAGALIIDDIDELDEASTTVLAYLLGRLSGTGLRIVASATTASATGPFGGLRRITLSRMGRREAAAAAAAVLPPYADRGVIAMLGLASAGSPAVIATARLTEREIRGLDVLPLPLRVDVESIDVQALAAAGTPQASLLHSLCLAPISAVHTFTADSGESDTLDDLVTRGVVEVGAGFVRITDPLHRFALYSAMTAEERRALHREAARNQAPREPRLAVWHLSAIEPAPALGPDLLHAARSLVDEGDVLAAIEFAERGVQFADVGPHRAGALIALAAALAERGEFALARHYARRAQTSELSPALVLQRARVLLLAAHAIQRAAETPGIDILLDAHREAAPAECGAVLATMAQLHLERWNISRAVQRMQHAAAVAPETYRLAAALLERIALAAGPADDRSRALDEVGQWEIELMTALSVTELTLLIRLYTATERYDAARGVGLLLSDGRSTPWPVRHKHVLLMLLWNEVRAGASDRVRDALAAWRSVELPETETDALDALVVVSALAVSADAPAEELDAAVAEARALCDRDRVRRFGDHLLVLEGSLALAAGRYAAAVDLLRRAGVGTSPLDPGVLRGDADLIEALWHLGRHGEARAELARFDAAVRRWPGHWAHSALRRAQAVCAEDDVADAVFESAFFAEESGTPDARRRLQAARLRRLEPRRPAGRAAPAAAFASLDSQEIEVAQLVQKGLRNREIALALYLSQRTIELRLTRIYRKLGIGSRARLVALMSAGE